MDALAVEAPGFAGGLCRDLASLSERPSLWQWSAGAVTAAGVTLTALN